MMLNPASVLITSLFVVQMSAAYAEPQIATSESGTNNNAIMEVGSDVALAAAQLAN